MKFLITILLLINTNLVFATKPAPPPPPVVTTTSTTTLITSYNTEGTASAMAAGQCQFDWTYELQGCVGGATYDGNDAVAFQLGKRYKKVLLNGGINYESGEYSAAGAINWKFK